MSPISQRICSDDLAEYETLLRGPWDLDIDQMQGGRGRFVFQGISIRQDIVYVEDYSRAISIRGALHKGSLVIAIPDPRTRDGLYWGKPCPPSAIVLITAGNEMDFVLPHYQNLVAIVREPEFRAHFRRAAGAEADFLDRVSPYLSIHPRTLDRLEAKWRRIARGDSRLPGGFSICRALAEDLALHVPESDPVQNAISVSARQLEDAIAKWEESEYEMSLSDIAGDLDLSLRTLRNWFHAHYGLGPNRYLRTLRLNQAHRLLLSADRGNDTVTDVAMRCGFYEFGKFSRDFRNQFGVLPSEVLKRPSPEPSKAVLMGAE